MRIVVLISNAGTGTNLQAIIEGVEEGRIKAQIKAVISDREDAPGLERAEKHGLPIEICRKKEDLLPLLCKLEPNYICLAGWKQIILDEVILAFPNKILNLHPGIIGGLTSGGLYSNLLGGESSTAKNPDGTPALWNKGKLADKAIQNFLEEKMTFA